MNLRRVVGAAMSIGLVSAGYLGVAPQARANTPETNAGGLNGTPPAAITVTPSDGLPATATVDISGTGFRPFRSVALEECQTTPVFACISIGIADPDSSGSFTAPARVVRSAFVSNGIQVDCTASGAQCVAEGIQPSVGSTAGPLQAFHHLSFATPTASYPLAVNGPDLAVNGPDLAAQSAPSLGRTDSSGGDVALTATVGALFLLQLGVCWGVRRRRRAIHAS